MISKKCRYILGISVFGYCVTLGSQMADNITQLYSCRSGQLECNYDFVSAFGSFGYDISGLNVNQLGTVLSDLIVTLKFPQAGEKVLYNFAPTKGGKVLYNYISSGDQFIDGETVSLLIVSFDLNASIPDSISNSLTKESLHILKREMAKGKKDFKSWVNFMYKIYNRFQDDQQWMEIATIFSQKPITSQMIKIKPDGVIVIANKKENEQEVLKAEKMGTVKVLDVNSF